MLSSLLGKGPCRENSHVVYCRIKEAFLLLLLFLLNFCVFGTCAHYLSFVTPSLFRGGSLSVSGDPTVGGTAHAVILSPPSAGYPHLVVMRVHPFSPVPVHSTSFFPSHPLRVKHQVTHSLVITQWDTADAEINAPFSAAGFTKTIARGRKLTSQVPPTVSTRLTQQD